VASRLERDAAGRLYAVISSPVPELPVGRALLVLGNEVASGADGTFAFTRTRTGRSNPVTQPRRSNRDPLHLDERITAEPASH
jgi:hypothetical protein